MVPTSSMFSKSSGLTRVLTLPTSLSVPGPKSAPMPELAMAAIAFAAAATCFVVVAFQVRLDLAHVPAHEAVTGLAVLDLLLGFEVGDSRAGDAQGGDTEDGAG
jgi:hypothetical protein